MTHRVVNLMADDDWSDADIVNRTEAIIASAFPPARFAILQRKVQGREFGYVLTDDEEAELLEYQTVCYHAGAAADQARADMALLRQAFAIEAAQRALAAVPPAPEDGQEDPHADGRTAAAAALQELLDAASPEVEQLLADREAQIPQPTVEADPPFQQ